MKVNDVDNMRIPIRQTKIRHLALVLACLMMFGNNYSFDNPQALQAQLEEELEIKISQYNLFYTAFSFPNIFLTLVGGIVVDFFGVRFGIVLFSFLITVSQTIIAIGGWTRSFIVILIGRVLFGVTSENMVIAQASIISKWFKGKELSTAVGYMMTVPELASALNSITTPLIYDIYGSLALPLFVSVGICALSFVCAVLLALMDKKADEDDKAGKFIIDNEEEQQHHEEPIERVSFADIKNLNGTFWILVLIATLVLGSYVPFLDDANDFAQEKFGFSAVTAGRVLTIPYIMSAITSPFLGPYVDKVGKRRLFIMATCVMFSITHLLFGLLESGEDGKPNWFSVIPFALLGSCYTLYSCILIPSIQYVVEERVMGTALGLLGMFESMALAGFPLLTAYIVETSSEEGDKQKGYSNVGYFFCGISLFALLFTVSLYFFDKKGSRILDFKNPLQLEEDEKKTLKLTESSSTSSDEDEDQEEQMDQMDEDVQQSNTLQTPKLGDRRVLVYRTYSLGK